ncbi:MAG TPA: M14 family metallopeptidase [Gemmataceae bacterium]|nr:M14 family metallopeptidase [Gemmataceae bacterium]
MWIRPFVWVLVATLVIASSYPSSAADADKLLTVAEQSNYRATSRHAQVVEFCERLAKQCPYVRLGQLGTSFEGRKLPLIILADPPVATAEEAAKTNKLVVFAMGNIHAGEVDGKEGLLMLARDIGMAAERPLLKNLILVIAPIFNADGNERMNKTNRRGQVGPEEGMGVRPNAQGFDLNRDYVKLESPECRALVHFLNVWDPAIVIDMHTTNGSYHRYTITYEGPRNPAGNAKVIAAVRDEMLPDVGRRLEKRSGYHSFFYGNFSRDRTGWETVEAIPRFGLHYVGLRNRIGILSESYSYASYRDRVLASRDFARSIFEYAADNKDKLQKLLKEARDETVQAGSDPQPTDQVAVQQRKAAIDRTVDFQGFVEEVKNGRHVATDQPKVYQLKYYGRCEPKVSVARPYAYLIPADFGKVIGVLHKHGIVVEKLMKDEDLDVEAYRVDKISRLQVFQKHNLESLKVSSRVEKRSAKAGTVVVRTAQPLGSLAIYLLEPESEDGLCTWNFLDGSIAEGKDYPILRLAKKTTLSLEPVRGE